MEILIESSKEFRAVEIPFIESNEKEVVKSSGWGCGKFFVGVAGAN